MAGYTKANTIDASASGDTVYEACVSRLDPNIDDLITWLSNVKKTYASSTAPASPAPDEGQQWWDSTNDILKVYNGSSWITCGGGQIVVDNINIDGSTIGHTSDTDILTFAATSLTVTTPTLTVTSSTAVGITTPTLTVTGKLATGSFSSPFDVGSTRQYGAELHYYGDNQNVTGIRSRASLRTTDASTKEARGAELQGANNDGIDAGVVQGAVIEGIGKSSATAATITTMRAAVLNTEWNAYDTVTNLKTLHVRTHTRNAATAGYISGTGYLVYIENEAVGGNGQVLDAGIYFKGTNLSAGNKAFTYAIDMTGIDGQVGTADIKLSDGGLIGGTSADVHCDDDGNWEIGTSGTAGASAAKCLVLTNGATGPSASANMVHLYAKDISTSAALAIYQEAAVAEDADESHYSHKLPVTINGSTYYIMLSSS